MYADFAFYNDVYRGVISEAEYSRLRVRAAAEIDRMTAGRAKSAQGATLCAVRLAECAVVDELAHQASGGDVTSESNDGISRSYATGAAARSPRQRIDAAAHTYLCGTELLYAGV